MSQQLDRRHFDNDLAHTVMTLATLHDQTISEGCKLRFHNEGYEPLVIDWMINTRTLLVAHLYPEGGIDNALLFLITDAGWLPLVSYTPKVTIVGWGSSGGQHVLANPNADHSWIEEDTADLRLIADAVEFCQMWVANLRGQGWLEHSVSCPVASAKGGDHVPA